jgi:hypothetical protein
MQCLILGIWLTIVAVAALPLFTHAFAFAGLESQAVQTQQQ